jgi:AcrR family transcriptional regulator
VDAIARRARVNKAMIYYHFDNKRALYLEILRAAFNALLHRTGAIVASDTSPDQKLADYIDAFGAEADAHPYLPRLMMLEVADGGRRLDGPTLQTMAGVFLNFKSILDEGAKAGAFRTVNPLLTYFNVVSPTVFYRAAKPVRESMTRLGLFEGRVDLADFSAHLKATALRGLRPDPGTGTAAGGTSRRGPGKTRRARHHSAGDNK